MMTGDGHESQDVSTQMTLEQSTFGCGIGEEAEKGHGSLGGAGACGRMKCRKGFFKKQGARGTSLRIFRASRSRARQPDTMAWKMFDLKLETTLELNVIQFLFYLGLTFLILQVCFAPVVFPVFWGDCIRGREKEG